MYQKSDGYVVNCKVSIDGEPEEDEQWYKKAMLECIADNRSKHLNSHVRVIYTPDEDKTTVTSPAKVAARRVDTVLSSSDEDDKIKSRREKLFEDDNSKHRTTKRKRTEKTGNPKTTGESDDEIDKIDDGSDTDESVKVVKPPTKISV